MMSEDPFRHARSRNVHPAIKRPKPLTEAEHNSRTSNLILLLATMKEEAWVLGLINTFRGLDRAEKAVGWEVAAMRMVAQLPSTRNSRTVRMQIRNAEKAVR